jgi:hypothetical protein
MQALNEADSQFLLELKSGGVRPVSWRFRRCDEKQLSATF